MHCRVHTHITRDSDLYNQQLQQLQALIQDDRLLLHGTEHAAAACIDTV